MTSIELKLATITYDELLVPKQTFGSIKEKYASADKDEKLGFAENQILNGLSVEQQLATIIFSEVAKSTKNSSNIWVYMNFNKAKENDGTVGGYHAFIDLESIELKFVPSLEYGDFCRNNSIINLNEYCKFLNISFQNKSEAFNLIRTLYFSEIARVDKFDNIDEHYKNVVDSFKRDGRYTIQQAKEASLNGRSRG